jgi:LacI family transcriptional regulator
MKVTLHEVAARADVSIATASRALNGLPVSADSLARVQSAAHALGYVANEAARALRAERTMTMGLIFSDLRNTLGIDLLDALSEAIEAAGYSLLISTARGDVARYDVLMRRFLERRVDALFCIRPAGASESLARYAAAEIPVMSLFSSAGAFAGLPLITPSLTEPSNAVGAHLRDLGHRRVAVVRGPGFPQAPVEAGLKHAGLAVVEIMPSEADGMAAALAELMALPERPTAVVAADPQSRGLLVACELAQVAVPGELSLVSVNETASDAHHRRHGLSAMTVDPARMGKAAAAAMVAWLAGAPPADRIKVPAASFIARGSSGLAP